MINKITIIDYGIGNLLSIGRAVEKCGFDFDITSNNEKICNASHIILPGVGAFKYAMSELKKRNLDNFIKLATKSGSKILGICLGMQLLFEMSEEFGKTEGLGLVNGKVIPVPNIDKNGKNQKIPIIGWYNLINIKNNNQNEIILNSNDSKFVYCVHSFMSQPKDESNIVASYSFGGYQIPAIIQKNNIYGCQFHPEKSGSVGLGIINNFCRLN